MIDQITQQIDARIEEILAEERLLRAARDVLSGKAAPSPAPPTKPARKPRKAPVRAHEREVIDTMKRMDRASFASLAEELGVAYETGRRLMLGLAARRLVVSDGVLDGRAVFKYVDPRNEPGPTERPNSAEQVERLAGVGAASQATGVPIAHTRAIGPSGRPGRDKKAAARGVRVRRGRMGT